MRILLQSDQEVRGDDGARTVYHAGIHNAPDDLAQMWIEQGVASLAANATPAVEPDVPPEPTDDIGGMPPDPFNEDE